MSNYALACALTFNGNITRKDLFRQELAGRYSSLLKQAYDWCHLLDHKPTRDERLQAKKEIAGLQTIVESNLQRLLQKALDKDATWPAPLDHSKKHKYFGDPYDTGADDYYLKQKALNPFIFNARMQQSISSLPRHEGVQLVLDDLLLAQAVRDNHSLFAVLEKKQKPVLQGFAYRKKIKEMDIDDQLQHGRMVLLRCAEQYTGKNFARFSSYFRAALQNAYIDLIKYHSADRRKTWKHTILAGDLSSTFDSVAAHQVQRVIAQEWFEEQRERATGFLPDDVSWDAIQPLKKVYVEQPDEALTVLKGTVEEVNDTNQVFSTEEAYDVISEYDKERRISNEAIWKKLAETRAQEKEIPPAEQDDADDVNLDLPF